MTDENAVFIGKKDTMSYVMAAVTQFKSGSDEVVIKARGKAISKAVDVAEITKNRFVSDAEIKAIVTETEKIPIEDEEQPTKVSAIEITMNI